MGWFQVLSVAALSLRASAIGPRSLRAPSDMADILPCSLHTNDKYIDIKNKYHALLEEHRELEGKHEGHVMRYDAHVLEFIALRENHLSLVNSHEELYEEYLEQVKRYEAHVVEFVALRNKFGEAQKRLAMTKSGAQVEAMIADAIRGARAEITKEITTALSGVYKKTETYSKSELYTKNDLYTRLESDKRFTGDAVVGDIVTDVDGLKSALKNAYTKAETDERFWDKGEANRRFAYRSDVYVRADSDKRYAYKATSYTKADSDKKYAYKAASYNKADSDKKYALKATSYTKADSDKKYAYKATSYTKADSDKKYAYKNAAVDAYTKAETDERFWDKGEANSRFAYKTDAYVKADSDKMYALKAVTYTKAETDERFWDKVEANRQFYTRVETDQRYPLKDAVYAKNELFTREETWSKFVQFHQVYTRTQSDEKYYSKDQADDEMDERIAEEMGEEFPMVVQPEILFNEHWDRTDVVLQKEDYWQSMPDMEELTMAVRAQQVVMVHFATSGHGGDSYLHTRLKLHGTEFSAARSGFGNTVYGSTSGAVFLDVFPGDFSMELEYTTGAANGIHWSKTGDEWSIRTLQAVGLGQGSTVLSAIHPENPHADSPLKVFTSNQWRTWDGLQDTIHLQTKTVVLAMYNIALETKSARPDHRHIVSKFNVDGETHVGSCFKVGDADNAHMQGMYVKELDVGKHDFKVMYRTPATEAQIRHTGWDDWMTRSMQIIALPRAQILINHSPTSSFNFPANSGWQTVDKKHVFTVTKSETIMAYYQIVADTFDGWFEGKMYLDGVEMKSSRSVVGNTRFGTLHGMYVKEVSAGEHTVEYKVRSNKAKSNNPSWGDWQGRQLIVLAL